MELLKKFELNFDINYVNGQLKNIELLAKEMFTPEYLKLAFSLIDLTTLNSTDQQSKGIAFANKVNNFSSNFNNIQNVAAICVYPPLVKATAQALKVSNVGIASVAACFPSSQSYIEVKTLECKMAVADGATDIDIVISLGPWFDGNYQLVYNEIAAIKQAVGNAHLKVILETGALQTVENIWNASIVAMAAGADFIKTSTGKMDPAATPMAVFIMCMAINEFYKQTGKKTAIKPAGGMVISPDALTYIAIVKSILGNDWLNNKMFRLGASRLANNLLTDIVSLETGQQTQVNYF